MRYYVGNSFYGVDLFHYGTKGMKRGVRRYQNKDGSLTDEGYEHYGRNKPTKKRKKSFLDPIKKRKSSGKKKVMDEATVKKGKEKWKKMSDEKLREATSRTNLENDYLKARKTQKDLTTRKKEEKKMSEAGKIILDGMMGILKSVTVEMVKANNKKD